MNRLFVLAKIAKAWFDRDVESIRFRSTLGGAVLTIPDKELINEAIFILEHENQIDFYRLAERMLVVNEKFEEILIDHYAKTKRQNP